MVDLFVGHRTPLVELSPIAWIANPALYSPVLKSVARKISFPDCAIPWRPIPRRCFRPRICPPIKPTFHLEEYHSLFPRFAAQRRLADLKEELNTRAFRFATGSAAIPPEQRFLLEDVGCADALSHQGRLGSGQDFRSKCAAITTLSAPKHSIPRWPDSAPKMCEPRWSLGVPATRLSRHPEDLERETCAAVKEEERMFCRSASFRVTQRPD